MSGIEIERMLKMIDANVDANLQVLRGVSLTPGTTSLTLPTQN